MLLPEEEEEEVVRVGQALWRQTLVRLPPG